MAIYINRCHDDDLQPRRSIVLCEPGGGFAVCGPGAESVSMLTRSGISELVALG